MFYKLSENDSLKLDNIVKAYSNIIILSSDVFFTRALTNSIRKRVSANSLSVNNLSSFGTVCNDSISSTHTIFNNLIEFLQASTSPNIYGKYFYVCEYSNLQSNEVTNLHKHLSLSRPTNDYLLITVVNNFKDYSKFKDYHNKSGTLVIGGYANNTVLKPLLVEYLEDNNIKLDTQTTLNNLMKQVGKYHSLYFDLVPRMDGLGSRVITNEILIHNLNDMVQVDDLDLLECILSSKTIKNTIRKNKTFTTSSSLIARNGISRTLANLHYLVKQLIDLKYKTIDGVIPMGTTLEVSKLKEMLGDSYDNISSYKLSRYLRILDCTSLLELLSIKTELQNCIKLDNVQCYYKFLDLVYRFREGTMEKQREDTKDKEA